MPHMPSTTPEMDCVSAVRKLWDYLDEELTEDRMEAVHQHLASCSSCLPHHDFAKAFLGALAATRDAGGGAPDQLRVRILEALRSAGYTA